MSAFTGPQYKGAMRNHRALKRAEAEARNTRPQSDAVDAVIEHRKAEAARQIAALRTQWFGSAR